MGGTVIGNIVIFVAGLLVGVFVGVATGVSIVKWAKS